MTKNSALQDAGRLAHRRLWVLTGTAASALQKLQPYLTAAHRCLWIGDAQYAAMDCIQAAAIKTILGREYDLVVFDAHAGFDPDALGAVAGTLCAGGVLVLLTPPLALWPGFADPNYQRIAVHPHEPQSMAGRYLQRLAQQVATCPCGQVIAVDEPLPALSLETSGRALLEGEAVTPDQAAAVAAILHVVEGHRRRPLVLTADRGRGKSASLGIAAAHLMQQRSAHILLTAPALANCDTLFQHAAACLPQATLTPGCLEWQGASLRFVAADALLQQLPTADVLLVDEAAAIPAPMLEAMLRHYSRIVFASTVHGYEGTGRGFALRFEQTLNAMTPAWRKLHMTTPIRWADDDPLEAWINDALLLNAEPVADSEVVAARVETCTIERLDRDALAEVDLKQLFGLLVLAHYRTRPMDVWQLLDGPNLELYVMRYQGQIVATAMLAFEGGFDAALSQAVYEGKRRPRGHLLAQSLATHAGIADAATLSYARIMRIAVHPAVQRRGLGRAMVHHLHREAAVGCCDALGVSFGLSVEVSRFWQRLGFKPVRCGLSREHTSGSHSLLMLLPLSSTAHAVNVTARQRFIESLPLLLSERLADMPAAHVVALLASFVDHASPLSQQDRQELEYFARGGGGYDINIALLNRWALWTLQTQAGQWTEPQQALLVHKILQRQSWQQVVQGLNLRGQAEALAQLRALAMQTVRQDTQPH